MLALRDNLFLAADALRAHKLRASLTMLGLTMGVATLIAVMTLVQGANLYVEQKIANLGTNVFRVSRLPFAVTDFSVLVRAQRNKNILLEDMQAVADQCAHCLYVGASVASTVGVRYRDRDLEDVTLYGYTPNMADIDTRTLASGRYFTEPENRHSAPVCLLGDRLVRELFTGVDPIGQTVRASGQEFMVVGTFDPIGSVLGQDQDAFMIIPLNTYLKIRGTRSSLTLEIKASGSEQLFQAAQDDVRVILRSRRHITGDREEDFYIGTAQSYISLWQSISSAFFAVFVMVSSISAVVGGIVIMNVMLVSVTERTKEIGVRRAIGATQNDILMQFLTESVMQCIVGGLIGVFMGFLCALAIRRLTSLPAAVQTWVALLGVILSSIIGLFFGIYPATKAARLDPVTALRTE
ncbi:MAG TPA: ABC transporter permease, partial [Bryobacteraceae bacterium]|nr:ABC transporter permease [Bryobacteraceae bacterium]